MQNLNRLLRPKSIAVIGGGVWCRSVIEQCKKVGFAGKIWPVYQKAKDVAGITAFNSVDDLPSAPDAAFIGVNRIATISVTKSLSGRGCGGAGCFASGLLEAAAEDEEGAPLQKQLLEAAAEMPIIGPNCYGLINYLDGVALWPDQHGGKRVSSGVAIITQSSNIAINISMQQRALPIAYIATAGNQAQTSLATIGQALLLDNRVSALGIHIEGFGNITAFEELAKAAKAAGKGIVAIKVGQSEQAQTAAISHTASLTGSEVGARAILKRLGIARLESLPEFMETLKLLHFSGPLAGNSIASISCSGGEASLIADISLSYAVQFPQLSKIQKAALRAVLGPMVALSNPLDYHTYIWGNGKAIGQMISAMMLGKQDLTILIVDFPRKDRCSASAWECVLEGAVIAMEKSSSPLAFVTTLSENLPEEVAEKLMALNVLPMHGLNEALAAIEASHFIASSRNVAHLPIITGKRSRDPLIVDEADSKNILYEYGLDVPRYGVASSPTEAISLGDLIGYPLVLKGQGIAHKTESCAVKVGLNSSADLRAALSEMDVQNYLVEEMVSNAVCELLVGVIRDPVYGFVLTLAAGGVMAELLGDQVSQILPVKREDVTQALRSLKICKVLMGYRGNSAAELDPIIDAVLAVQSYVIDNVNEVEEVEINPLIATPERAIAVDALIRKGDYDG